MSATDVGRRHGVATSTLHNRAADEGWRRKDKPSVPLDDDAAYLEESCGGDLDEIPAFELAALANTRMRRAVLEARPTDVLRWHRIHALMWQEARDLAHFLQEEKEAEARLLALKQARQRQAEILATPIVEPEQSE